MDYSQGTEQLTGKGNICYTSFWDKQLNHHTFQVSDSCNSKAQKGCCFQMVLVLSCNIARCLVQMEAESRTKFTWTRGCSHSMEWGAISRPSILLTATDSELQLASTSSLFLESSSASTSFEVAPAKTRQQKDEVSGQP